MSTLISMQATTDKKNDLTLGLVRHDFLVVGLQQWIVFVVLNVLLVVVMMGMERLLMASKSTQTIDDAQLKQATTQVQGKLFDFFQLEDQDPQRHNNRAGNNPGYCYYDCNSMVDKRNNSQLHIRVRASASWCSSHVKDMAIDVAGVTTALTSASKTALTSLTSLAKK